MNDPKGSIWRKWDFHVHTPFSVLNNGFGTDFDKYVKVLFTEALAKDIAMIGITDYFTIEGYKKLVNDYLNNQEKLESLFSNEEICKIKNLLILPNIEFRLHDLVNGKRLNFHVILSNELSIQDIEEHFLHDLDFVHESFPFDKDNTRKLKQSNLIELGKKLKAEQPEFTEDDIFVGMSTATVHHKDISKKLTDSRFKDKYIIGVPPDSDLSDINWASQETMIRKTLIQKSNFLFASNPKTVKWGLGKLSSSPDDFIKEFKTLKPCIWGSDAHEFPKLFEPDLSRYCWIKADTTFEGLRQILFEPEERVYIGKEPEFLNIVRNNPTKYFNKLVVKPISTYSGKNGKWFDNISIEFNSGLCGIIGNKGKGKSAIADILGLLGESKVTEKTTKDKLFSFLNKEKFCKKGFAENFEAELYWNDAKKSSKKLSDDVDFTEYERIKYIPQKFFEDLCSTQDDEHFRQELNKVVYSRVESKDKLGKATFDEFIKYKTEIIEIEIDKLKNSLDIINNEISDLERRRSAEYKNSIINKIKGKLDELDAHKKLKDEIVEIKNPSEDDKLSSEQKLKSEKIITLDKDIADRQLIIKGHHDRQDKLEIEKYELFRFLEDITELRNYIKDWKLERKESLKKYEIEIDKIIRFDVNTIQIDTEKKKKEDELTKIERLLSEESIIDEQNNEISLLVQLEKIQIERNRLEGELEKPFKDFHDYQLIIKNWQEKLIEIEGKEDIPNTLKYFQKEQKYLEKELGNDLKNHYKTRNETTKIIYRKKKEIQDIYNSIKTSISELLTTYSFDQQITLETSFQIDSSFYIAFFEQFVKRYKDFYQSSDNLLKDMVSNYDFDNENNAIAFIDEILKKEKILKDTTNEIEFHNYLFSLDFLNSRYNLKLNNKGLNELSPGERGGLLLIFYLILDKDDKPLVIDQPEDNLDNQSVSEILVPYIREAKKRRQIVMVTHNPNLAVVSDADQIIRMKIEKENDYLVSHISGGIENPIINKAVVDILEGRIKAFNNRRLKYYTKE